MLPSSENLNDKIRVSFAYTAASGKKITLDRQPNINDITGNASYADIFRSETAGQTVIRIATADMVGVTTGSTIDIPNSKFTAGTAHTADQSDTGTHWSAEDAAKMAVGMSASWAKYDGATEWTGVITAIQDVDGSTNKNIVFNTGFNNPVASGDVFTFHGAIKQGTTITNIATPEGVTTYKNVTISNGLVLALTTSSGQYYISDGWTISADLTAAMIETTSVSGDPSVVTKRQNERVHITGTVSLSASGTAAKNINIKPDYFTVSNI